MESNPTIYCCSLNHRRIIHSSYRGSIKEGLWVKGLMKNLGINQSIAKIYCDNQSTIHLSKNPQFHSRTKHIDIKFNFVREKIKAWKIEVLKVHSWNNIVDMLRKLVSKLKLQKWFELVDFNLPEHVQIKSKIKDLKAEGLDLFPVTSSCKHLIYLHVCWVFKR